MSGRASIHIMRLRLCLESCFELAMETFNHAIRMRVVCCSAGSFGSKECHEGIPHLRFELATTVSDNSGRYTKARDPATEESMSHSFSSDAGERNSFGPLCKMIHTGQEVRVMVGVQQGQCG